MRLLTVNEFSKQVQMCAHTVRRAIISGKINAIRPGVGKKSPYRIPETEIERLVVAGRFK